MSDNKTTFFTASKSGFGLNIAWILAQADYGIVLHGLVSQDEGHALEQEFRDLYGMK